MCSCQDRSALPQPERRMTKAVRRAFEKSAAVQKSRRPGRDVARRRVEPAAQPGFKYMRVYGLAKAAQQHRQTLRTTSRRRTRLLFI